MRNLLALVLGAATLGSLSCGDVVRDGRSPVMLVLNSLRGSAGENPVLSDVARADGGIFNDLGQAVLTSVLKNVVPPSPVVGPTLPTPTTNNSVTVSRYRVVYRRADGRNTAGVDVPHAFDGAVTGTVTVGAAATLPFELVRHVAKEESPLAQLASNPLVITTLTEVTFYGTDRVGNDISVTGTIQVNFANFADQD